MREACSLHLNQGEVIYMNSIRNGHLSGLRSAVAHGRLWLIAGLIVAMCACLGGEIRSARAANPAPAKTTWDGVYTDNEAARGKAQYNTSCSSCHMEDMS